MDDRDAFSGARRSGNQQVRHACEVGGDDAAVDVLAHRHRELCHSLLHTLYEQVTGLQIPVYEEWVALSLVVEERRCVGVLGLHFFEGRLIPIQAKAVILATGGYGRIYFRSTNAVINTGSGCFLAYQAGVPLEDMEFVQFHPTTLFGTNILIRSAE